MFKPGKQFLLDESVLDLSGSNTSGMPVVNGSNHHPSSVSSMSSSRHHHQSSHHLARNSSPFNGSDNDVAAAGVAGGMPAAGGDFDNDLLSGEDGQGISQVKWTREKIAKLLDLYGKFRVKIEDPKYRKTEIWNKIAKALSDYDGITVIGKQCWDKFRYMKARYLRAREQKRRVATGLLNGSETSMITFPYFNELQELLGDTPFEQELSALGAAKREPADTFDNADVDDFPEQQDAKPSGDDYVDNGYDDVSATFVNSLSSNRRKRKYVSSSQTASHLDALYGDQLTNNFHPSQHNDTQKFSLGFDGLTSFYNNSSRSNNNNNSNANADGTALSSFMSAVIEMENRKLELFKRFVDLYEKRTALSSSSSAISSLSTMSHHHPTAGTSRFRRSTPAGGYSRSGPSNKLSSSASSIGVSLATSNNNGNSSSNANGNQ